jgi:hypothetical protein
VLEERRGVGASSMTEEPKRQSSSEVKDFFLANPTIVLSLLYVYVTAIGLVYSGVLYARFGINIFDYSEIGDFLLAAFKNPFAFVPAVVVVAIAAYTFSSTARIVREKSRERSDYYDDVAAKFETVERRRSNLNDEDIRRYTKDIRQLHELTEEESRKRLRMIVIATLLMVFFP